MSERRATVERTTRETAIQVQLCLDGSGAGRIETPLPFLSHMLEQIGRHALFDLTVLATGDAEIDGHHTTEDVALVLGRAVLEALGPKTGIRRYGSATLPMDEALVTAALDLSGRAYAVYDAPIPKAKIGQWDAELAEVFFEAFARGAQANVHIILHRGQNLHHIVECCFKAFARALREAVELDPRGGSVPSTKGTLDESA